MIATGSTFHVTIVMLPLVLLYLLVFTLGIGLFLSAGVVYFRDIEHFYSVFLTAFTYLTPIFYPVSLLPDWLKNLMIYNPMYDYITMFRNIMIYGTWPVLTDHLICIAFSIGSLIFGIIFFKRHQRNFILHI